MRVMAFGALVFGASLALAACADLGVTRAPIVRGAPATLEDLRGTVAVLWETPTAGTATCTGTVIAQDVIVTAAHCVVGLDAELRITGRAEPAEVTVVAGALHALSGTPSQTFAVARVAAHPDFPRPLSFDDPTGLSRHDDVAVLVLARAIEGVDVVPILPLERVDAELTPGTALVIAGYGEAETTIVDLHVATTPFVRRSDHEILIGGLGEPDICSGDSGGPAYLEVGGATFLVGVASRVRFDGDHSCGNGSIESLAPAYLEWIASVLSPGPDAGTRDAGSAADAGASDASNGDTASGDAATGDAGRVPAEAGCACRVSARGGLTPLGLALLLALAAGRSALTIARTRRARARGDRSPPARGPGPSGLRASPPTPRA